MFAMYADRVGSRGWLVGLSWMTFGFRRLFRKRRPTDTAAAQIEATWRERALNAEHELKRAHDEIALQRTRIGELLGHIRDLENDLPADGVQRLLTETHTLKARVRQLSEDNSRLEERLAGSRDNNRFLDKRIADLEAELANHVTVDQHPVPSGSQS